MHFRVAVGEYFPFLILKMDNSQIQMTGPLAEAFQILANRANFTYSLLRAEGDVWGSLGPNGWTGLLGMLARNEVDFALGPFTMSYSRWKAFPMSVPMYADVVEMLVPSLDPNISLFNMVTVFSYQVWIMLLFSMFSFCILLSTLDVYENVDKCFIRSFLNNFWDVTRTLLQKPKLRRPTGYQRVMLVVLWLLITLVIATIFCGVIQADLLLRRGAKIDSIEDLNNSLDVLPIIEDQSSIYSAFKDGQSDIFQSIYAKTLQSPEKSILTFKNMSTVGMDFVYAKSFAMITDGMGLRHFLRKRHRDGLPCNFRLARETLWPLWKAIAFGHSFPKEWIRKFNVIIRRLFESNWLYQRMIHEFSDYTECLLDAQKIGVETLNMQHVLGVFIIWAIGILVSTVVFLAEVFCLKKTKPKKFVDGPIYRGRIVYRSTLYY